MANIDETEARKHVKAYYGEVLKSSQDLKTTACTVSQTANAEVNAILREIEPEILNRFYGCGSPIPPALSGCTVLDLGCGTGRDSFICSKLVGEQGSVIGLDMTDEQLEVAQRLSAKQAKVFGFSKPNTSFRKGYMEDLAGADIADNSVDVVISNCVINLAPNKQDVFREIFRVLKPGGELFFSDIFSDRRLDPALCRDPTLLGECLAGALYVEDFRRMLEQLSVFDHRVVTSHSVSITDAAVRRKLGAACFTSQTVRAFKLASLEDRCEDYRQVATYKGTIAGCETVFTLDDHHSFEMHRPKLVCGNTAAMLQETRFGRYFNVEGDRSRHFGVFGCTPAELSTGATENATPSACCS